ncbi:hypothetical protein OAF25_01530 [Akkermansiaceae bacterium]|nr:hypothetical protein [Akkermansiaceae bacterium]
MLDIVMHKALKEGATHLDSYAVKNDRKPSGLLPTLYAKHSWTISDSASYDPQYLGKTKTQRDKKEKALVESWEDQGWDRTLHGMPDVVFMTHERTASNATEFQRDDTEGVASSDGKKWSKPVAKGKGESAITEIAFDPTDAKYVRITQTGKHKLFWSIHELNINGKEIN